ncbi:MAG: hypothetical protein AAGF85_15970 [Bacteroidota bacterium]
MIFCSFMIYEQSIDSYMGKSGHWEDKISQIVIDYAHELAKIN